MDILSHYSTYTPARTATTGQSGVNRSQLKGMSGDEFLALVREQGVKPVDKSKFLYNGSETRAQLSDTEIAVLANKYNPHDMDQETYDAFLNDLQSMGAISEMEKRQMSYDGMQLCAYMGEDGNWVKCGSPDGVWELPADYTTNGECIFTPWGADTDIYKWLEKRTRNELVSVFEPSTWEQGQNYENLLKSVLKVVGRMDARRKEDAAATEKAELRRQIADPTSEFYTKMLLDLTEKAEKTKEDKEQQDIVEALGAVLDALSGKKDVSGDKVSLGKAASEMAKKVGDRISQLDPDDPECIQLKQMLQRFQELGIYTDLGEMDDVWEPDEDTFETLTQLLTRRQKEETLISTPQ